VKFKPIVVGTLTEFQQFHDRLKAQSKSNEIDGTAEILYRENSHVAHPGLPGCSDGFAGHKPTIYVWPFSTSMAQLGQDKRHNRVQKQ
jgi:hypothetical protein